MTIMIKNDRSGSDAVIIDQRFRQVFIQHCDFLLGMALSTISRYFVLQCENDCTGESFVFTSECPQIFTDF